MEYKIYDQVALTGIPLWLGVCVAGPGARQ